MTAEEAVLRLPSLVKVVDPGWLRRNVSWFEAENMPRFEYYEQADEDLRALAGRLRADKLISAYRDMLRDRDQVVQAIYEIHAAALLADVATGFDVHVHRAPGSEVNYDVAAKIAGTWVHADCKTRRDDFPFNLPRRSEGPEGITGHFGSRATVDPLEAPYLGIGLDRHQGDPYHKVTPESSVVRDLMAQGLVQLPESGANVVILGQIAGRQDHLERALYGPEIVDMHPDPAVPAEWERAPTGAFGPGEAGKAFVRLSAVLWMRLWLWDGPLGRAYRLYENPNARYPIPPDVSAALRGVMTRCTRGGGE